LAVGSSELDEVAWIEAGASGCVGADASLEEVIGAIEKVAAGELVVSPAVTASLITRLRRLSPNGPHGRSNDELTPREAEVLDLLARGLSNKEIAQQLWVQPQTVKNHVHNVLVKLGVTCRADAAVLARRSRLDRAERTVKIRHREDSLG
jgi:DNA-binding NarL/FixJ family response regulator